jgi:hypothetical protein
MICFNGKQPHLDSHLKSTLNILSAMIPGFLDHVALVFSELPSGQSETNLKKMFQAKFNQLYQTDKIPAFFVDANNQYMQRRTESLVELVQYIINKDTRCDVAETSIFGADKIWLERERNETLDRIVTLYNSIRQLKELNQRLDIDQLMSWVAKTTKFGLIGAASIFSASMIGITTVPSVVTAAPFAYIGYKVADIIMKFMDS